MRTIDSTLEDVEPEIYFHTSGEFSLTLSAVVFP